MYRILTEEKHAEQVKATLTGLGLDFTLYRVRGSWRGHEENTLAIELDNISRNLFLLGLNCMGLVVYGLFLTRKKQRSTSGIAKCSKSRKRPGKRAKQTRVSTRCPEKCHYGVVKLRVEP
jgi:hypothetical protein